MTLFMPPIQRKKKVDEKYNPDTFRVISEHAVSDHPKYRPLPYRASFEPRTPTPKAPVQQANNNAADVCQKPPQILEPLFPLKNTRVFPQVLPDHRANKPQTKSCGFLDRNVRFLNEPICNVYTKPVQHEEKYWWPSRANPGDLSIPPYTEETHYRIDFNCRYGDRPSGSGRHTSNTERQPGYGIVPVNYMREKDGSQRFYKEGLSYEHMYDSRADPNYPVRGRRHGAFVWSRMDPMSQRKFVEYYTRLDEEERAAQENGQDGPLTQMSKTGSAPVVRSANHAQNFRQRKGSVSSQASSVNGKIKASASDVGVPSAAAPSPVAEEVVKVDNSTAPDAKLPSPVQVVQNGATAQMNENPQLEPSSLTQEVQAQEDAES